MVEGAAEGTDEGSTDSPKHPIAKAREKCKADCDAVKDSCQAGCFGNTKRIREREKKIARFGDCSTECDYSQAKCYSACLTGKKCQPTYVCSLNSKQQENDGTCAVNR